MNPPRELNALTKSRKTVAKQEKTSKRRRRRALNNNRRYPSPTKIVKLFLQSRTNRFTTGNHCMAEPRVSAPQFRPLRVLTCECTDVCSRSSNRGLLRSRSLAFLLLARFRRVNRSWKIRITITEAHEIRRSRSNRYQSQMF
jgi:hypothetical protein